MGRKWSLRSTKEQKILQRIEQVGRDISDITTQIFVGIQTSADKIYVLEDITEKDDIIRGRSKSVGEYIEIESEITEPFIGGDDVHRYGSISTDKRIIYPYDDSGDIYREPRLKKEFPKTYEYLKKHESELKDRGSKKHVYEPWYEHWRPRSPEQFKREKILMPDIAKEGAATYDSKGSVFHSTTVYSPILESEYEEIAKPILGILNSRLIWYYINSTGTVLRGGYYRYKTDYIEPISIPVEDDLSTLEVNVEKILEFRKKLDSINRDLLDYLGNYSDGPSLAEIEVYEPPDGVADSMLTATTEDYDNLRIGEAVCERDGKHTVLIRVTARYKPENQDTHETDRWGYTETEPMPAMRLTDLSKTEANLVEAFVPVAVEEAGGFANFRETATKTNSLIDRLEALTLPDPDDVADDLDRYMDAVERAEELDEKIEKTDNLIDEIVYELYGLTDEEIEIVEEAVGD